MRLIRLRWLSVLAMLVVAVLSAQVGADDDLLPRLLAVAAILGAMNVVLLLVARRTRGDPEEQPILSAFAQLAIDLLAWASYIYLSGGASNPLTTVFLPLVAIGAMVLGRTQAWLLGGLAIVAYSGLWRYHLPLASGDPLTAMRLHVVGMWLVFVVSDVVVVWFIVQMSKAIAERDTALANAREQAIRNDWLVSMGSLAAGAAHELSTPLATLDLVVDELLEARRAPCSLRPDLELMRRQIEVCKQALTRLAQRAGYPRSDERTRADAAAWIKRVTDAWLGLNPAANVSVELAPDLEKCEVGFDLALERALANLFDNALQAGAARIVVRARQADGRLLVTVDDDAPGISSRALKSFLAGQPVRSAQGMGVGLLLARAALERVGGSLRILRQQPRGTQACLALPIAGKDGNNA